MDSFRFIDNCLPLIPALPLAAAIFTAVFGPWVSRRAGQWQFVLALPVIAALAASCVLSLVLVRTVQFEQQEQLDRDAGAGQIATGFERIVTLWTWASVHDAYELRDSGNSQPDSAPPALDAGWKNFQIAVALRADALTAMMLGMVTFVSTLVAIFAAGYMAGDRGYWRFFAYIGLFVFSMTMLVSASNFVLLYVFWEAVGLCSYLLIGFWYEKPSAVAAGMKAFLVNRVGDFGFAIALFLIWTTYGTLNFHDSLAGGSTDREAIAEQLGATQRSAAGDSAQQSASQVVRGVLGRNRLIQNDYATDMRAVAICLLLLLGACGKSAQFPLHVWLPDAMEGPTPVSALIHAATMVTAGVYMIARCSPLFAASPEAQLTVAVVGVVTALLGGLIALTQFDLKRVLAYSTISQLGYMFLALGTGTLAGVTGGMFHLFTHAFFKALLFLGAGSVMHAMGGVIDMRKFGGLARLMPWTYATFLVGCLALCGIFPLSGFWSKDSILGAVHDKVEQLEQVREARHLAGGSQHEEPDRLAQSFARLTDGQLAAYRGIYEGLFYAGLLAAFLTAFYTFRAFSLTFHGEERIPQEAGHHAHESPPVMTVPLVILAFCAVVVGVWAMGVDQFLKGDWGRIGLAEFLGQTPSLAAGSVALTAGAHEFHMTVAGVSTLVAAAGIGLSLYLYLGERNEVAFLQKLFDAEGVDKLADPQWVVQLERVPWIGAVTRGLRQAGLGFLVTLVGLLLGTLSLILALPLVVLRYLSPYKLSFGKFFFDEIYDALIVTPLKWLSAACYWMDRWLVDGLVNLAGSLPPAVGSLMRGLQGGLVQFYAIAMVLGVLILIAARLLLAG
jgi:NADH-quinone oxidoreductase subunit L